MTLREKAIALLGTWARPPDLPAKIALVLAALLAGVALFGRGTDLLDPRSLSRRRFLQGIALAAALLSIAYLATYLRGGPRIIDASTYFLQGRALSHGDLSWTPPEGASASFRGRFLIHRESGPEAPSLGGIFPPGYPLLLAFGFTLGTPMIVGPLLAAGLVVATYHLARLLAEETLPTLAEPIARAAALLSVVCVALRYHTADTMSHAASALGVSVALLAALHARRLPDGRGHALLAGLAVGYVVATRPVSALPIALVVAGALGARRTAFAVVGALPGIFLLLLAQRAVTGAWLTSTQRMYYANSDGPPGCFRFGFGAGTGCVFEHGDFVRAHLPNGYGALEAAGTTLRRLHAHVLDVANLEPLALLVVVPVARLRRPAVVAASLLVALQILAYVPFYFDGDYPGGGARFFADVLPVEHALVMLGVASLASARFERAASAALALALAGFGVHAVFEHHKLRDRDGGRPMFEPDVLAHASIKNGLVFVDTDHGFALGHDPAARPDTRVLVARLRSDARDRMLYDAMGHPPTWLYKLDGEREKTPSLAPWVPPEPKGTYRFEAEAEWPALSQGGGHAVPVWASACASGQRALVLTPAGAERARATITLPVPTSGRFMVELELAHVGAIPGARGAIVVGTERWEVTGGTADGCTVLPARELQLEAPAAPVTLETSGGPLGLDAFVLRKLP